MDFAIGLVELQALVAAIYCLDVMLKTADVEFVAVERRLGGRLVTLVIRGDISAVNAAVEAGAKAAEELGHLKAREVIARPHPEILKFLNL
jgi:microcompartment protein CcmL/EutN